MLLFLEMGTDVNVMDAKSSTPLKYGGCRENNDVIEFSIEHRVDTSITDKVGWATLQFAVKEDHTLLVKILLNNGANIE